MSERFSLLTFGPIITPAMRAAREDGISEGLPVPPAACIYPHCEAPGDLHRRNTAYIEDSSNWICVCPEHAAEDDADMAAQWAGVL